MIPTSDETLIGYVTDVQANGMTANLIDDETGRSPIATVGDEDVLVGKSVRMFWFRRGTHKPWRWSRGLLSTKNWFRSILEKVQRNLYAPHLPCVPLLSSLWVR